MNQEKVAFEKVTYYEGVASEEEGEVTFCI